MSTPPPQLSSRREVIDFSALMGTAGLTGDEVRRLLRLAKAWRRDRESPGLEDTIIKETSGRYSVQTEGEDLWVTVRGVEVRVP